MFQDKRILITGAAGSVGSELVKTFLKQGAIVCAFDNDENGLFALDQMLSPAYSKNLRLFLGDVRDEMRVSKAFEGIDLVFHCAALKHVYLSEYNPFEAMQTNIYGTNNVINAAIKSRVKKVIYTSSDKAVNPSSTMGASKLLGERLIAAANHHSGGNITKFCSVRFGNVLNTRGSVLQIFNQQILHNLPITITSKNMTRFFLSMDQAVELCIYACKNVIGGEIFVKNMGSCNILSLAKAISPDTNNFEFIGLKSGEKLYEELVTEIEAERTYYKDSWYMIVPDTMDHMNVKQAQLYKKLINKLPKIKSSLRSDKELMTDKMVYKMLLEFGLITK